jgi:hypothetical protein
VLVSDTVGFIKQLPHDLVASFKSTLDEALEASLLLFVVDASDPTYEAQLEVSRTVLREIGADVVPSRLLLNKIDWVGDDVRAALPARHPDAILLSLKSPADVAALRETIIAFFEASMVEDELVLPYAKQGLLGEVYEGAQVLSEEYDAAGRVLKVRGLPAAIAPRPAPPRPTPARKPWPGGRTPLGFSDGVDLQTLLPPRPAQGSGTAPDAAIDTPTLGRGARIKAERGLRIDGIMARCHKRPAPDASTPKHLTTHCPTNGRLEYEDQRTRRNLCNERKFSGRGISENTCGQVVQETSPT